MRWLLGTWIAATLVTAGCAEGNVRALPQEAGAALREGGTGPREAAPESQGGCRPEMCQGCCAAGICRAGDKVEACGKGGAQCVVCPPTTVCSGGACVPAGDARVDQGCSGDGRKPADQGPLTDHGPLADKRPAVDRCTDQCVATKTRCSGVNIQTCELQSSGCTDWDPAVSCGAGKVCSGDVCVNQCTNQCTVNATKCSGTTDIQTCKLQSSGCTDWDPAVSCGTDRTCKNNQCVCDPVANCAGKECGPDGCGGTCGSCTKTNHTCDTGSGRCKCDPVCYPRCPGMPDGCGGQCTTVNAQCPGCCVGTTCYFAIGNTLCGKNNSQCVDCTASGKTCNTSTGACQ